MSKKISLGAAIGLIALAIALTVSVTMTASSKIYNSLLKYLPEKIQTYSKLEEIRSIVENSFYGSTDSDRIDAAVAQGFIGGLGDKYSKYMTADEYSDYSARIKGQMTGIGISYSRSGDNIKIDEVYEGSPAQISGLEAGDVIVAFDSEAITSDNYDDMLLKLNGDTLSTVNLTYRRNKETEKTVSVPKDYEAQSVTSHANNQLGYIKISDFYSTTAEQVKTVLDKFISQGATGLILDLRGNSGTNFAAAADVVNLFVPLAEGSGAIAEIKKGDVTVDSFPSTSNSVSVPVVVIVNKKTLGGAEFLACELRASGNAEIIGTKTVGMGIAQEVFELSDGSALLLSVGEIIPYKSKSFNKVGIEPDHTVEEAKKVKDISEDPVYLYAVSILTQSDS